MAIIGFTNAVNFTDGIDGLATGVTIPVLIFFVFVANITYNAELSVLSMVVIGACIGFLVCQSSYESTLANIITFYIWRNKDQK